MSFALKVSFTFRVHFHATSLGITYIKFVNYISSLKYPFHFSYRSSSNLNWLVSSARSSTPHLLEMTVKKLKKVSIVFYNNKKSPYPYV